MDERYDVVVVGSGPAGCTAAILLGRQGLRVALVETHRSLQYYKRLCTHYIQASALPTLQRLGADTGVEAAGGVRNSVAFWSRFGWVYEPVDPTRPPHGYNVHRSILDPMLRRMAAEVPAVDLLLGGKVGDLTRDARGRVNGVTVRLEGNDRQVSARLVIGADGRHSTVAERAGLPGKEFPNARLGYFATYRGVHVPGAVSSRIWLQEPDVNFAFGNEDGTTVLGTMRDKREQSNLDVADRERWLLDGFTGLSLAPDISGAERISDVTGTRDYPSLARRRIVDPGVALVGDAALVADPLWGIGLGWALQSAEWLVDAVDGALHAGSVIERDRLLDRSLRRYQRRHRLRLLPHQFLAVDFSSGRPLNPLERLMFDAATEDEQVAAAFYRFGTRSSSPAAILSPSVLARAITARRRRRRRRPPVAPEPAPLPADRRQSVRA
jgi:flavin-dependent dehydrogenase